MHLRIVIVIIASLRSFGLVPALLLATSMKPPVVCCVVPFTYICGWLKPYKSHLTTLNLPEFRLQFRSVLMY
jgi:hypothetical protein